MNKKYNYKEVLNQYIKHDPENNQFGLFQLGQMYFYGKTYPQDINKAIAIFEEIGPTFPSSYTFLGLSYLNGDVVPKNHTKAFAYLEKAAKEDDNEALVYLSNLYLNSTYVDQNISKAISLLKKAIKNGDHNGMVHLAVLYMDSPFIKANYQKAYDLLVHAESLGNPYASTFLGVMYENGNYLSKNLKKAFQYYLKGTSGNSTIAHFFLGQMYYNGEVVTKNINEAINHFSIAAYYGHKEAFYKLIEIYFDKNSDYNAGDGKNFLRLLIEDNDPLAFYKYGELLLEGVFYDQNIKLGLKYLRKSNTIEAYCLLGKTYSEGMLVNKNNNLALFYYYMAIELGNIEAMVSAAKLIKENAISINYLDLLKTADKFNYFEASALLGECYLIGKNVRRNSKHAYNLFYKAANNKNPLGLRYLGYCYLNGIGTEINQNIALKYYKEAAELGDTDAIKVLSSFDLEGLNNEKLISYYEIGVNLNSTKAIYELALFYIKIDILKTFALLKKAIALGSVAAKIKYKELMSI